MLFDQIRSNKRKTVLIMICFLLIVDLFGGLVGWFVGANSGEGSTGIVQTIIKACLWTFVICVIYILIMMSQSINVVMAMNHGQEIKSEKQAPVLWNAVSNMAIAANLPMPRVFIIKDPSPNAFSTGNSPKNSAIGATTGLLNMMDQYEVEGVIGHEMSHIKDRDTEVETVGVALTALFAFLGGFLWRITWDASWFDWGDDDDRGDNDSHGVLIVIGLGLAVLSWICSGLSYLGQMALSRNREYLADAGSVDLTRNPDEIIRALKALRHRPSMKAANPASNSLFIVNPHKPKHHWSIANLFDTHPPLDKRIERLERMKYQE